MTDKIKGHIHAELMAEYAEVAKTNPEPWKEFEYYEPEDEYWDSLSTHPAWSTHLKYRRKPRTIRIGEYDVPAPLDIKPSKGNIYYCVSFNKSCYVNTTFDDDDFDMHYFNNGLAHATKEAAILHTKAILSLIEKVTEND